MTAVIAIKVTRYQCTTCSRTWSKRAAAEDHASRCWWKPENRTCLTCVHHERGYDGGCNERPGCQCQVVPESCALDLMPEEDGRLVVRVGCPGWNT